MKKSKRIITICALAFLLGMSILSVHVLATPTASEEAKSLILSCNEISGASPVSLSIRDRVLFAEIQSNGNGRCTIEDIKSINDIYSVALGTGLTEKFDYIDITIIDVTDTVIYDYRRITTIPQAIDAEMGAVEAVDAEMGDSAMDILLPSQNYTVLEAENKEHPIETSLIKVTVEVENETDATIDDLTDIFFKANRYGRRTIDTQCEVSLQNTDGEVIAYMGGNARYGTSVAWVAPELEETFFE